MGDDRAVPLFVVPRVLVTPARVAVLPPEVDSGNRLLRKFTPQAAQHCFLRVSFTEEDGAPINLSQDNVDNVEAFNRVRALCGGGLELGSRRYVFLASSNSQYRTFGAWCYCQLSKCPTTPAHIRTTMGNISCIRPVAKAASRLAQALTTTVATVKVHVRP